MKKIILVLFAIFMLGFQDEISVSDQVLLTAFQNAQTDLQVNGEGTVIKLLPFMLGFQDESTDVVQDKLTEVVQDEISVNDQVLLTAFQNAQTDLQVNGEGTVIKLLPFRLGFHDESTDVVQDEISVNDQVLLTAFQNAQTDLQVNGEGNVIKLLPDDTSGSQHKKFILEMSTGQTLLVSHNIDLAPMIYSLEIGDSIEFYGEYEWNDQGGVIHWTHIDPNGSHIDGWLIHNGTIYE